MYEESFWWRFSINEWLVRGGSEAFDVWQRLLLRYFMLICCGIRLH